MTLEESMITAARAELERQGQPDRPLTFEEARHIVAGAIRGVDSIMVEALTPESPMPDAWGKVEVMGAGAATDACPGCAICKPVKSDIRDMHEINDSLAAKVAEWKARAERAEAALKAAEDDRHLTTPCA